MKSGSEQRHHGAKCVFRKTIGNGIKEKIYEYRNISS